MEQKLYSLNGNNENRPREVEGMVIDVPENISHSGLLCRTAQKIKEMTLLDIRFQLPEIEPNTTGENIWVECSGVVVHCDRKITVNGEPPYEVAIFFNNISDRCRGLLSRYGKNKIKRFI